MEVLNQIQKVTFMKHENKWGIASIWNISICNHNRWLNQRCGIERVWNFLNNEVMILNQFIIENLNNCI